MTCAELEILLCDWVDGTLDNERKGVVAAHLEECAACAELVRDAAAAVAFMERAAAIEVPQELVTRILFETQSKPQPGKHRGAVRRFVRGWLQPILQPRFAMGMAMTILSFSMLGKFAGINPRQLRPADLSPVAVYAALEDKVHRAWQRALKHYESLRLVYEIQSRLKEWSDQEEIDRKTDRRETKPQPGTEKPSGATTTGQTPEGARGR
jgi:hypothetical protein